jgi:hypothetical protein
MRPHGSMLHGSVLCGMFTQHLTDTPGTESQASRYGVGVTLRSQEIREAILADKGLRKERKEEDEDYAKEKSEAPKLHSASRFVRNESTVAPTEDLMEKLLQVPKDEATASDQVEE